MIWFASEGNNKTERLYFEAIDCDYVFQYVRCQETDPVGLMKYLLAKFEAEGIPEDGDVGFCIVDADLDPAKDKQLRQADLMARDNDRIRLIVSAPCFEVWYLCHFIYSTRQYANSDELLKELRNYPGFEKYNKSDRGIYDKLLDKLPIAIKNAKRLEEEAIELDKQPHTTEFTPATEVYKIIQFIQETKPDNQS